MGDYGIKGANIHDSDIRATLKNGVFSEKFQNMIEPVAKAYQVPDTMGRYVGWKSNIKQFTKLFPDASPEQVKRLAAHSINDTYQNYDKLSKVFKQLTRWGVAPQFASFTAEFMRNQYNQGKTIAQMFAGTFGADMGMGEPNRRAMIVEAGKRLAALTAVYSATWGTIEALKATSGVTDKKEDALRDTTYAEWDKNKNLLVSLNEDGRTGFTMNTSYICLLYTSPSPRDGLLSRMPSSA